TGRQMVQTSAAIAASVSAVRVVVVWLHPTRKDAIASVTSTINTLAVRDLESIEHRLFDIGTLCPPGDLHGELEQQLQDGKPGHYDGLLAGKRYVAIAASTATKEACSSGVARSSGRTPNATSAPAAAPTIEPISFE